MKAEISRQSSQQSKDLSLELSVNSVYVYPIRTQPVSAANNRLLKHKWELISLSNERKEDSEPGMHS